MKKNNDNVLSDIDDVLNTSSSSRNHFKLHYNPFEEDPYSGPRTPGHHKHSTKSSSPSSSPSKSSINSPYSPNGYGRGTFASPPNSPGLIKSQSLPTISEPIDNIRMKIKEAVHTALWTEKMQEEYNSFMTKLKESINKKFKKFKLKRKRFFLRSINIIF
jgi:hypothetical protein